MNREILRLAIPNILSTLSVPLLGMVDTALMGHEKGPYSLAGIALGGIIFSLIYMFFGFLRMSTTGFTAQAKGKEDEHEQSQILARTLLLALAGSAVVLLFKDSISYACFSLLDVIKPGSGDQALVSAKIYYDVRIWAAPATLSLYAITGWLLGMQDAKTPLILTVGSNVANIILSIVFVKQGHGIEGVALGTALSQYAGAIAGLAIIKFKYNRHLKGIEFKALGQGKKYSRFLLISADIVVRTIALIVVLNFFTVASYRQGVDFTNTNQILMQLWMLVSFGIDGFAIAAESLVGKYMGQQNKAQLKKAIRVSFIWGMAIASVFSLVYIVAQDPIVSLFVSNEKKYLMDMIDQYYGWIVIAPLINTSCFLWDGVYVGATAGKAMRNSMVISAALVFFPTYFMTQNHGNHGLWFALSLFMMSRGVTLTLSLKKSILSQIN